MELQDEIGQANARSALGLHPVNSKARKLENSSAKKAFTLVELLVTMALMGLLATVSTVGYYAAVRGMNDRSARQVVVSTLRFAMQRALIDELPVAVFLCNETVKVAKDDLEENKVVGKMTVVRMGGRITYVNDREIVDEFADWGSAYPVHERHDANASKRSTMSMYRLVPNGTGLKDSKSDYLSQVTDYVYEIRKSSAEELLASGLVLKGLHENKADIPGNNPNNSNFSQGSVNYAPFYGFYVEDGCTKWEVGDAYGFEIAQMQLPDGYLFDSSSGAQVGDTRDAEVLFFNPARAGYGDATLDMSSVKIYASRPGKGLQVIATVSKSDLEDKKQ